MQDGGGEAWVHRRPFLGYRELLVLVAEGEMILGKLRRGRHLSGAPQLMPPVATASWCGVLTACSWPAAERVTGADRSGEAVRAHVPSPPSAWLSLGQRAGPGSPENLAGCCLVTCSQSDGGKSISAQGLPWRPMKSL